MRLIASFDDERKAFGLYSLLLKAKIDSIYESKANPQRIASVYDVWIVSEEDFEEAMICYDRFIESPEIYIEKELAEAKESFLKQEPEVKLADSLEGLKIKQFPKPLVRIRLKAPITRWIIFVCVLIFFWTTVERAVLIKKSPSLAENVTFTPVSQYLFYDFPARFQKLYQFFMDHPTLNKKETFKWSIKERSEYQNIKQMPVWQGFYEVIVKWPQGKKFLDAPIFSKIVEGEYWRIWSPVFLHGNFLHILFNMLWLFLLGREVELKIGKGRYIWMMLLIGAISNTAQYLMSGPFFLGYSGIICGLGGFIWVREKKAPWEGYSVPRGTLAFLLIFVVGMVVLQIIAFVMSVMSFGEFSVSKLGNTAHVTGLACGCILAKVPLFYRLRQ